MPDLEDELLSVHWLGAQDKHCYNGIRVKEFKTRDKALAFANLEENCPEGERMDYVIVEADSLNETIDNT